MGWIAYVGQSSGLSLANHLACAHVWPDSKTLPGVPVYLSAKMNSSMNVSTRLAGHSTGWQLLPPLAPYLLWGPFSHACGLRNPMDHMNEKNMINSTFTTLNKIKSMHLVPVSEEDKMDG